jgi:HlyD family secretion protein
MISDNGIQLNGDRDRKIRILVVDDQRMIREGLKVLLDPEPDLEVVGTAADGESAVEQVESLRPDVVLLDMEMPGVDGVTTTQTICQQFEDVKVLVLSSYDNNDYVQQSLDVGAKGYLLKGTPAEELRAAIRSISKGYVHIGPGLFEKINTPTARVEVGSAIARSPLQTKKIATPAAASNGNGGAKAALAVSPKNESLVAPFEQKVILKQSPLWSRAIIWTIIGVTTFGVIWSAFAKIEQVVPAQGELKPQGKVKEIQAPVNGVVKEVFVEDGDKVKKGQVIAILDPTASKAELASYKKIKQALTQENKFYETLMDGSPDPSAVERSIARLNLPKQIIPLARNRITLIAENQLYSAQLNGDVKTAKLSAEQLARLQTAQQESTSRAQAARLEVSQLEKQLAQNQVQLTDAKIQLIEDKNTLAEIKARNNQAVAEAKASLERDQKILDDIEPLLEEGALASLQVERQKQSVSDRRAQLIEQQSNGTIEYNKQFQQVQTRQAEIARFTEEGNRLRLDINQASEQLTNTVALSDKEVRDKIAENEKRLADIDSQLTKVMVDNENRISELESQISRAQQTLNYQEVKAPVNGTVFDLKAGAGYVTPPTQTEPLLKIVPDDYLIAEVNVTNEDIGFVRRDMKADVRINTFSFSEFGDIKGQVVSIGSDALPPDEINRVARFPIKIKLDQQALNVRGRDPLELQSGMAITANIKVNEDRTVLSLFTELFEKKIDDIKGVR